MNEQEQPFISVVMPVYNAGRFVQSAIDSVLSQTLDDFEFIILDDCSTDSSRDIVAGFTDKRIRFVENDRNLGVARTLNKGFSMARGTYIARMDADDISQPTRFAKQHAFLERNPDVAICGTWVWRFDSQKKFLLRYPVGKECVRAFLLFGNPLAHPSVMMRREEMLKNNLLYDSQCLAAQDFELWSRSGQYCGMDNLPVPLLSWRQNQAGVTSSRFTQSNEVSLHILRTMLTKLEINFDEEKLLFHREVGNGSGVGSLRELDQVSDWLTYLLRINHEKKVFSPEGLEEAAAFVWQRVCLNSSGLGMKAFFRYMQSPLQRLSKSGIHELLYMFSNALLKYNRLPTGRITPYQS